MNFFIYFLSCIQENIHTVFINLTINVSRRTACTVNFNSGWISIIILMPLSYTPVVRVHLRFCISQLNSIEGNKGKFQRRWAFEFSEDSWKIDYKCTCVAFQNLNVKGCVSSLKLYVRDPTREMPITSRPLARKSASTFFRPRFTPQLKLLLGWWNIPIGGWLTQFAGWPY